ncbi:integumentary mucin C.1-like [Ylistrum balloti]|uniref:integumentary mucin C.1-like n=1 Tax=Ylistrum balloti TaxID=509963 RepID=UPI002905964D|nr:integumentary mucin C.1-like [Ylistrum balloti]
MVHGKPRHLQSQGSAERANSDIKDILVGWISDNQIQDWTVGLKFVQQKKNCANHEGNRAPNKVNFGEDPKVALISSSLPPEILDRPQSEDGLLALYQPPLPTRAEPSIPTTTEPPPSTTTTTETLPSTTTTTETLPSTTTTTEPLPSTITTTELPSTTTTTEPSPSTITSTEISPSTTNTTEP